MIKDIECKFEADTLLMERDFHTSLLESIDAAFKRGHQAMASLYLEAAHEFESGKGVFLPNWEVLFC